MKSIDLNVDIGEGFPHDAELLRFATSANVACGEHAGSWELTVETVELCRSRKVRIGMHPGFPDRETMGRAEPIEWNPVYSASLLGQAKRFMDVCPAAYIKPHGAWYNALVRLSATELQKREGAAFDVELVDILELYPIDLMILPCASIAHRMPGRVIREGFADRGYQPNGQLTPRSEPGAILHEPDEIREQVLRLATEVDSICLHGDTPGCLEFAELVYKTLTDSGFKVSP